MLLGASWHDFTRVNKNMTKYNEIIVWYSHVQPISARNEADFQRLFSLNWRCDVSVLYFQSPFDAVMLGVNFTRYPIERKQAMSCCGQGARGRNNALLHFSSRSWWTQIWEKRILKFLPPSRLSRFSGTSSETKNLTLISSFFFKSPTSEKSKYLPDMVDENNSKPV